MKMLQYEKIDASEGIDVNKTSASKECELCHYWLFKDIGFKLENVAILNPKSATFRFILWGINRNQGLRRLNNSVLEDKSVLYMDFGANKTHLFWY